MKSETFKLFDLPVSYHEILDFLPRIFTINNGFDGDEIVGFLMFYSLVSWTLANSPGCWSFID